MARPFISSLNTLSQNFDLAYADGQISRLDLGVMRIALRHQARVSNGYPGSDAFERAYAVNRLESSGAEEMMRALRIMHPAGRASMDCTIATRACTRAQDLHDRGYAKLQVARALSLGFVVQDLAF